jgi:hypothetical protein
MDYNGLLTRLIESERRQRSGWFVDLVRVAGSDARLIESERRQRSGL